MVENTKDESFAGDVLHDLTAVHVKTMYGLNPVDNLN